MQEPLERALLGSAILQQVAEPVHDYSDPELQQLIDAMLTTINITHGVGLAAPQVFHSIRLIIVASHPNERYPNAPMMEPTPMLNPQILWSSKRQEKDWEGCLSIPGIRALVPRAKEIQVSFYTREGMPVTATFEGFVARIIQHEIDHLAGISFLERVDNNREMIAESEYKKRMQQG